MNIDEPMYRLMIHGFRDTFYWINMDNYTYIDVDMDVGYGQTIELDIHTVHRGVLW